jgi:cytosine/adenosine deaminase-related metal-dependent hydrolase
MTDRLLISGGIVVTMDDDVDDLNGGDVLVENGVIAAVGDHVDAGDCLRLDAGGMIVMPGLVDAHRHLWYSAIRGVGMDATLHEMVSVYWPQLAAHYTPEDLYVATRAGAVDALGHGVTTVFDWCHVINSPDHGPEAVRALAEVGLRTVFAYGASMGRKLGEYEGKTEHEDSWEPARRLRAGTLSSDAGRVTMALALQGPEFTTMDVTQQDIAVARGLNLPMSMHCGIPAGTPPREAIASLVSAGVLGADMQFVHCCATSDAEFARLAGTGARAVACPMAELAMGMGEPPVGRMREAGLPTAVGCDAVCTASGDLFEEARVALFSERGRHARARVAAGHPVGDSSQLGMTAREALQAITIGGAHACWLEDRVGSLAPGKLADVILLRTTDLNLSPVTDVVGMVASSAHASNVDTVIVGGKIVMRGGTFIDIDARRVQQDLEACRDRLQTAGGFVPPGPLGARSMEEVDR